MIAKTHASLAPLAVLLLLVASTLFVLATLGVSLVGPLIAVGMAAAITIPMAFAFAHHSDPPETD
jgi:hypothetical protein